MPEEKDKIINKDIMNRLKTIKGHIAGIEKMIEEDKACEDVLLQIVAIKASIHKVGLVIIEEYAKKCLMNTEGRESVCNEQVKKVLDTMMKFLK